MSNFPSMIRKLCSGVLTLKLREMLSQELQETCSLKYSFWRLKEHRIKLYLYFQFYIVFDSFLMVF